MNIELLKELLQEAELICCRTVTDLTKMQYGKLNKDFYMANIANNLNMITYLLSEIESIRHEQNLSLKGCK